MKTNVNPRTHTTRALIACMAWMLTPGPLLAERPEPATVAREVDRIIEEALESSTSVAPPSVSADSTFLRRAYLRIAGTPPTPADLTYFVLDPDPDKRAGLVDRLLRADVAPDDESDQDWARNWARYWRDAVFATVQDRRVLRQRTVFEDWLAERFRRDVGWDDIARAMVAVSGDVSENGAAALIAAQQADPVKVAAETARLFMGIQIQCAECHDHPYDEWRREQFHEMAAFFPRVRLERKKDGDNRPDFVIASFDPSPGRGGRGRGFLDDPKPFFDRFDANGDGRLARKELPRRVRPQLSRLLRIADRDDDEALSLEEIAAAPTGRRRSRGEHFMPDLENPEATGTYMAPRFFTSGQSPGEGTSDLERREALAEYLTAAENPWFAKAFVNRVWAEMIGTGFVMPVDDLGPGRALAAPEVFDLLALEFRRSGYSLRWLLSTVARTRAFAVAAPHDRGPAGLTAPTPLACRVTPLRGDQLFDSLARALDLPSERRDVRAAGGAYRGAGGLRALIAGLFDYDPSAPPEDVAGTIPQTLFLMNSRLVENAISARGSPARGGSALRELVAAGEDSGSIVHELYLRVLCRPPSEREAVVCAEYVKSAPDRSEALEDVYWSLLNSAEFLHHR